MYGYLAGFQVATGEFLFFYLCKMVWSLSGGLFLSCLIYFQNVSSISKNDNSQKNVTRDSLLRSIAHAQQCPPKSMLDPSDWIEQLEKEKELLASLPADAQLQIRRPLPVQPQAWLTTAAGPKMVVASTPLLILSPNKIAMGELPDYDANNRRAPRRPKSTADEPLIPRLWLYQKETTL